MEGDKSRRKWPSLAYIMMQSFMLSYAIESILVFLGFIPTQISYEMDLIPDK